MIPARYRGRTDLAINGSFWIGGALGAASSIVLLDPAVIDPELGWRLAFLIGSTLGLVILFLRAFIPESPRWLVIHGREEEAERIVRRDRGRGRGTSRNAGAALKPMRIRPRTIHAAYRGVPHAFRHLSPPRPGRS